MVIMSLESIKHLFMFTVHALYICNMGWIGYAHCI